jgi:hypothetical protein
VAATLIVLALAACDLSSALIPINEKISWTGMVFESRDPAVVAELLSPDAARRLVAEYDEGLEIVALHSGELSPNVSGPATSAMLSRRSDAGSSSRTYSSSMPRRAR